MKCAYCGKQFHKKHNRQIYCTPECSKKAHQDQINKSWRKWYHKNKKRLYQTQLGTRTIGAKPNPNPQKEAEIIQKEKQRILQNKT